MKRNLNIIYFSATNTTQKVVTGLADSIMKKMDITVISREIDFTLPEIRERPVSFTKDDIVVIGVPVYAGRVPNVLLKYLDTINGNGAKVVATVVYGNRNYDDALIELKDILESKGFIVVAGCAFVGEHSFSRTLAANRPDEKDMAVMREFAKKISNKLIAQDNLPTLTVKGNKPYRNYYIPKDKIGNPVDIRKVTPKTNNSCVDCKLCVSLCPMGSIDAEDVSKLNGICIKCGACIKKCPANAKYYDNEDYLRHKHELEVEFTTRREPALFL